jgi:hypothetical protein
MVWLSDICDNNIQSSKDWNVDPARGGFIEKDVESLENSFCILQRIHQYGGQISYVILQINLLVK